MRQIRAMTSPSGRVAHGWIARHLGTRARLSVNLQTRYDLALAERDHSARVAAECRPRRLKNSRPPFHAPPEVLAQSPESRRGIPAADCEPGGSVYEVRRLQGGRIELREAR